MQYRIFPLNADFKGLFLDLKKRGGCKFGDFFVKKVGCIVSQLVPKLNFFINENIC